MRIAIISGGSIQEEFASGFLTEWKPDRIIAADRGLAYCLRTGIVPDLVLGDFDSLPEGAGMDNILQEVKNDRLLGVHHGTGREAEVASEIETIGSEINRGTDCIELGGRTVRVIRFNPEKDATDTELAVEQAVQAGAEEICLLGGTGTRLDHVWGNFSLLYRLREQGIRGWIVDAHNRIHMPAEHRVTLARDGQFGTYVSILPYGGPVTDLTLTGFKYPLDQFTLNPGTASLCVSNEIIADTAEIRYTDGAPVIVESRD